ncbi:MAG TPA: type II secretion system major pseudopilin GspG [Rhabdochlamydiaceae bacterium]
MKFPSSIRRESLLRRESGYTLLEIMLVLGIIALLLSAGIYMMAGNLDIAKEMRVKSDVQAISIQLQTYEMLNNRVPTTEQGLQALVSMPTADPKPRHWKKLWKNDDVPRDPWDQPYVYRNPGKYNTDGFDLYSLGPKGKDGVPTDNIVK